MKKLFLIVVSMVWCVCAQAWTERNIMTSRFSRDDVKKSLVLNRQWVTIPAYSDREAWQALMGDYKDEYIRRGEALLDYSWPRVKATDYLEFERSGNRKIMENPAAANNVAVHDLLLAELAEGKGRFIDQLINGVYVGAEMTTWSLSAHNKNQPSKRAIQAYDFQVIDLAAADLGNLYGWVYYLMKDEFDKIDPEISRRLRHELQTRILSPYLEYDGFWWQARKYNGKSVLNNWTPWCCSNCMLTFMLLEDDADKYAEAVYQSMLSVDKFLNYIKADGACEEGPSYWGHAAGKLMDFVELLKQATGGRIDFTGEKMVRDMGEYVSRSYVGDGWVVNFADASAKGGGDPFLIYRYGKLTGSDEMMGFAAYLNANPAAPRNTRDVYRTFASLQVRPELQATKPYHRQAPLTWYPETEFCYITTPQGLFFAGKGGFNNESHNHNDAGTFSLWADNFPLIIDAGVGTYTRQTFNKKERYKIWTMQSGWHNLPVVNGCMQPFGSKYMASDVKVSKNRFELSLAGAYPSDAGIRKWHRAYDVKGRQVRVTDEFDLQEATTPNVVNFMTWGTIDTSVPGKIRIDAQGHKAEMAYDASRFAVEVTDRELPDPRLSTVWGPKISRISFTDLKPAKKGKYSFTIKAL